MIFERTRPPRRLHHLECRQWVELELAGVFAFHADARNLELVTPPWLGFQILSNPSLQMEEGARIDYRVRWHGLPIRWQTEITAWEPPHRFVDVQRRGPFRWWEHEHRFVSDKGGTWVEERVDYAGPPLPFLHELAVRPDVEKIFAYRRRTLEDLLSSADRPESADSG